MPFRSRRFAPRARAVKKRSIWVNVPFIMNFSETAVTQLLVAPEDWEPSFTGLSFDKALLEGIRGVLWWHQTAAGTLATSQAMWGLYTTAIADTAAPTWTVTGMGTKEWLKVDSFCIQGTLSGTNASLQRQEINIKTKRRLTSNTSIYLGGQIGADAATPTAAVGGVLRFLIRPL